MRSLRALGLLSPRHSGLLAFNPVYVGLAPMLMIGQTLSHYRIIKELGKGGMGVVYLAEDTLLGRQVAIKMLKEAGGPGREHYAIRFLREAQHASKLSHPHIATIHDFGETPEGRPYIVMEYVKGKTLGDLIQDQTLTLKRAVEIVTDVAEALSEAHRNGIVHRDIKPSNIAINERGVVKVLDFGLAKHLNGLPEFDDPSAQAMLDTRTREGVIVCTPEYSSPEQAMGVAIDARSDLFSLGSVLYECVTGKRVFSGLNDADTRAQVIQKDPPPPSTHNSAITKELDRISLKALAKKVDERYQSAEELLEDLRPVRESLRRAVPVPVRITASKTRTLRTSFLSALSHELRRPRFLAASFLLSLGVALAAVWASSSWFRRVSARSPQCAEAMSRGINALRDGTYDRAEKAFDQAVGICNDLPLAHARLAETLTELEYTDRAQKELLRTKQPDPSDASIESLSLQAIRLTLTGDPRSATEVYQKIVQQSVEGEERAAAYVDLGRAYERDGYPATAVESYKKALEIDPQQIGAAMRLGVIYGRRQDAKSTEAALSYFQIAESRYQSTNDAEGLAEVSFQRGVLHTTRREFVAAHEQLKRALSNAEAIDNKYLQIKSRIQLSNVFCVEGNTAEAERYAAEALDFAKANGLEVLTANSLVTLGNSFIPRGEFEQAQKYLQRALDMADYYKTRRSKARALLALASLESQRHSRPERVREYVQQAFPIVQEDGYRKWEMQGQELLGHANVQQGDYSEARLAFERQLELAKEYDDKDQMSRAYEGHGITLLAQEDYTAALLDFDRNLEIARAVGLKPNITHALSNRGSVLWRLGRYDEAEQSLVESRQLAEAAENPDPEMLAHLRLIDAQMALSRRRFGSAELEGREVLKMAGEQFEALAIEARSTVGLAQALSGRAKYGTHLCAEAVERARRLGTPRLISTALLALASAKLETGNTQGALSDALEARETFKRSGQQESEWHALLIAVLASKWHGDEPLARGFAVDAVEVLGIFEQRFGAGAYERYMTRPDVQRSQAQFTREFASSIGH